MGPAIAERLTPLEDQQIAKLIRDGAPAKGMPPSVVDDPEISDVELAQHPGYRSARPNLAFKI